jgi:aminoglycoside phosphotransferase (APT) family kinase protein
VERLEPEERARRIAEFARVQSGRSPVEVSGLRRLAGGSSRQVWSLDLTIGEGAEAERRALVLRIDPKHGRGESPSAAGGFAAEFRLLSVVHRAGCPVPRVYWSCEDAQLLGGPFYLMDRIEGETIPRRILRDDAHAAAREKLPEQLGSALARIHAVDPRAEGLDFLPAPPAGSTAPEVQLAQVRAGFDLSPSPNPTLELVYRWLERDVPPERDRTLVHGDYRMGNVVVGPEGLRAVLDWELAHVGDPHEDLAWMCTKTWRFGNFDLPVGGVGAREPFYRAYERESGRKLDRDALRYWEVLCSAKVATVWIYQVRAYLSGIIPSVEQAAIGRRMAETELDLLELLEVEA